MVETASKQEPRPVHLRVLLEVPDQPEREFSYDFQKSVISMGRDPDNDIQIPLTTVSRHHARIFFEMGDYFLEDLGSTHGTEHNGSKLGKGEKRLLRDGDRIRVMSFNISFKTTASTSMDRQPGEKTEHHARRMVQEVLSSLGGNQTEPPSLRVMNGIDEGNRYELADDASEIVLGRSPETDLPLNDANVSRRHCLIKRDWHGFTAQDLGSKNGVIINGKRIEGATLIKDGDIIQIGSVKLTFIDPPSRLLAQMGGLDNVTMDPEGVGETDGSAEEEEHEEHAPAPDPAEQMHEPEDEPDPEPMMADEDEEEEEEDDGLIFEGVPPELAAVTKKGVAWDVIILVLGALFFVCAIGLVALLIM